MEIKEEMKKAYGVFERRPFLEESTIISHLGDFKHIQDEIHAQLKDYPNFDGIDFRDVSANGIQIRGFHKEIKGYDFGEQTTIEYDFSNVEEAIKEFVENWKKADTPERLKLDKDFIAYMSKYGCD